MMQDKKTITIRSVSSETVDRLSQLRSYSRLTLGSLLDDAVAALWDAYEAEGHDLGGQLSEAA